MVPHTVLWRIHATAGEHVMPWNRLRHFGPLDGRFDPHAPPPHEQVAGVLYLALDVPTCVAEVYQGLGSSTGTTVRPTSRACG